MHHTGLFERGHDSNYTEYISLALQIYISAVGSRLLLKWEAGTGESWPVFGTRMEWLAGLSYIDRIQHLYSIMFHIDSKSTI